MKTTNRICPQTISTLLARIGLFVSGTVIFLAFNVVSAFYLPGGFLPKADTNQGADRKTILPSFTQKSDKDGSLMTIMNGITNSSNLRESHQGTDSVRQQSNTVLVNVAVSLPTMSAAPGANISVPLTVGDLTGLGAISYDFRLSFNNARLQLQATPITQTGTLSSGGTVTTNSDQANGQLTVSFFSSTALSGSGTLLFINFTVSGAAGTSSPLTFINHPLTGVPFQFNEGNPSANPLTNGQINIGSSSIESVILKATIYDSGTFLEWQTGREIANLGFNIYRQADGKRTLINPHLIAGSALKTGANLLTGESYTWWDQVSSLNAVYFIEDVDLNGRSSYHGPVSPKLDGGTPPLHRQAALFSNFGNSTTDTSQPVEVRATSEMRGSAQQSSFVSEPAIKITIQHEGIYRLTQPQLVAVGLPKEVDAKRLQLFVDGCEVPIKVSLGKDGSFDESAYLEFYGLGLDTPSTDARTYWLTIGSQTGKRIQVQRGEGVSSISSSFIQTVERRDHSIYFAALLNGDKENFFGTVVTSNPVEQIVNVTHLEMNSSQLATLEVSLQGVTYQPHRVAAQVNGFDLGEVSFNQQEDGIKKFVVPVDRLREGQNVVRFLAQNGTSDISLVDKIRLSYPHTFRADEDSLRWTAQGRETVTITGFTSKQIHIFDVTDANNVCELMSSIAEQKNGYSITVAPPEAGERVLLALTDERVKHPTTMKIDEPSNLRSAKNVADFVIITERAFFAALEPFKQQRENLGWRLAIVDIEDIYDEFNFGHKNPQAIKDFLEYATKNWQTKPRYVMLVGDASYDSRNYLGFNNDLVPTKLIDATYLETASDDWFADFNNDGIAEMAVGRLPVRNPAEITSLLAKLLRYDYSKSPASVLLVSDSNDGYDFEKASAQLSSLIPSTIKVEELQRGKIPTDEAKARLLNALSTGTRIINYNGHSSVGVWRGNLLTTDDARALTNEIPAIFVMMSCLSGYFHNTTTDSLSESLMKADGGAIAVWASSGQTSPAAQEQMNQQMYRLLFSNTKAATLGEVTMRAKAATPDRDVRRTWILLGDPTLPLR
jgi:hypothetical protein